MKEIRINVPITKDEFHEFYLKVMNSISKEKMQGREIQVLAAYMRKYDSLLDKGPEERIAAITSTETRREIREQFGINEQNMNNILAKLKKKGQFKDGAFKWFLRYDEIERIIFDLK